MKVNIMRLRSVYFLVLILLLFTASHVVKAEPAMFEPITQEALEKTMFDSNPQGCILRFNLFTVALNGYKEGESVESMADIKVLEPFLGSIYETIRTQGIGKAMVESMNTLQSCAEKYQNPEAQENSDAAKDEATTEILVEQSQEKGIKSERYSEKQVEVLSKCGAMNAIALTAIDGVENKRDQALVESLVAEIEIDTSGTPLEAIENPQKHIVSRVYDAGKESYDEAANAGYSMVMMCFIRRR